MGDGFEFPLIRAKQLATILGATALLVTGCGSAVLPTQSELPLSRQDPGQQVAPTDAKPGDFLVAGDKTFMLLGAGKFLDYSAGKVINAGQIPPDLGLGGGYFQLSDAPNPRP